MNLDTSEFSFNTQYIETISKVKSLEEKKQFRTKQVA